MEGTRRRKRGEQCEVKRSKRDTYRKLPVLLAAYRNTRDVQYLVAARDVEPGNLHVVHMLFTHLIRMHADIDHIMAVYGDIGRLTNHSDKAQSCAYLLCMHRINADYGALPTRGGEITDKLLSYTTESPHVQAGCLYCRLFRVTCKRLAAAPVALMRYMKLYSCAALTCERHRDASMRAYVAALVSAYRTHSSPVHGSTWCTILAGPLPKMVEFMLQRQHEDIVDAFLAIESPLLAPVRDLYLTILEMEVTIVPMPVPAVTAPPTTAPATTAPPAPTPADSITADIRAYLMQVN